MKRLNLNFFFLKLMPVLVLGIMIIVLSCFQVPKPLRQLFYGLDKELHFIMYGVFTVFVFRLIFFFSKRGKILLSAVLSVLLTTLLGILGEINQFWIPRRQLDTDDVFYNIYGSISGIVVYLLFIFLRKRFSK